MEGLKRASGGEWGALDELEGYAFASGVRGLDSNPHARLFEAMLYGIARPTTHQLEEKRFSDLVRQGLQPESHHRINRAFRMQRELGNELRDSE